MPQSTYIATHRIEVSKPGCILLCTSYSFHTVWLIDQFLLIFGIAILPYKSVHKVISYKNKLQTR